MTRILDLVLSLISFIVLLPIFLVISLWINLDSKGGVFYRQKRVGKNGVEFIMFKFRTMYEKSDKNGFLTIGEEDKRITQSGKFLRKYKLDELPQLINVFLGQMSIVGPRPEVRKYVDLYTADQLAVLSVLPGITDYASVQYADENKILAAQPNPEKYYIEVIMPEKIRLNQVFIQSPSLKNYFRVILLTIKKIIGR